MKPRRMGFAGHVAIWDRREEHTELWWVGGWGDSEEKISVEIPSRRWQDNIKMDFK